MTTKLLDTLLQEYWLLIEKDEKQSILIFMKTFLKNRVIQEQKRISIEQHNKELEEAEARIDSGNYITHEDVKKIAATW